MSHQILAVLEYMEKEKGIPRDKMIETISKAIEMAAQKGINAGQDIRVVIHPKTGALKAHAVYQVVDSVGDFQREMHINKAREIDPKVKLGETVQVEVDPAFLGRIAAQAARQAITSSVKQHERARVQDEFQDQVGQIVSGIIRRKEIHENRSTGEFITDFVVEIGKVEGLLSRHDIIPNEELKVGDRVRALLVGLNSHGSGPELILSRTSPKFVAALLQLEVSELADGTVKIMRLVREPGYRTKIAVMTDDPHVDPVGSCVGARGVRVKNIVKELAGEKLDVIRYSEDLGRFLAEAIKPVVPYNLSIDEENQRLRFEVAESDLALVIGKKGLNARLTSRLLNWRLDIATKNNDQENFDLRRKKSLEELLSMDGMTDDLAIRLIDIGITSPEALTGVTVNDLVGAGIEMSSAVAVIDCYKNYHKNLPSDVQE